VSESAQVGGGDRKAGSIEGPMQGQVATGMLAKTVDHGDGTDRLAHWQTAQACQFDAVVGAKQNRIR
jgi:hypothetical protein